MYFCLNYNNHSIDVCLSTISADGYPVLRPLRNFGLDEGAAKIFKFEVCPRLSVREIRRYLRSYSYSKESYNVYSQLVFNF